jgi:hypothetical protein
MIAPKGDVVFVRVHGISVCVVVGEQRRLRFLRKGAGAVCLVAFAGNAFAVQPVSAIRVNVSGRKETRAAGIGKRRLFRFMVG